ncbi:hypothetical protein F2P81_015391 [Scophthalmus maximus]|uniref:Acid-sensing ion channel 2-like n=1 Tax=Scophthalmus maximus TaxID=52904 RepID=A0A6A4SPV5_SCOMX|nr:hypothetical protein F2P81_015391 [Scophthalmus maximus]
MALEGRCLRRGSPAMLRKSCQRHPTRPALARVTSTLLSRTRLHGLRHVCFPGGSVGRRAFWLLALCTSLGLLLSWSSNRLLHWLSFPTHTRVHTEWAKELAFPTVTICNNNPIRLYKLTKSDLYFAGHWLGLLLANRTVRPMVLDLLQEDRRAWFRKLSDFRLFLPPRNFEGTNLEFMDRLSHQLDDMLLSCKYRGEPCGAHNFSSMASIALNFFGKSIKSRSAAEPNDTKASERRADNTRPKAGQVAFHQWRPNATVSSAPAFSPIGAAKLCGSFDFPAGLWDKSALWTTSE